MKDYWILKYFLKTFCNFWMLNYMLEFCRNDNIWQIFTNILVRLYWNRLKLVDDYKIIIFSVSSYKCKNICSPHIYILFMPNIILLFIIKFRRTTKHILIYIKSYLHVSHKVFLNLSVKIHLWSKIKHGK